MTRALSNLMMPTLSDWSGLPSLILVQIEEKCGKLNPPASFLLVVRTRACGEARIRGVVVT